MDGSPPLVGGAVLVDAGKVVEVGPREQVVRRACGTTVRDHTGVLVPGLVNAHTHLEYGPAFADLASAGLAFPDWIAQLTARRRPFTDADWLVAARGSGHAALRTGTTAVADIVTCGDSGRPIMLDKPTSFAAQAYVAIATELHDRLQGLPPRALKPFTWTWEPSEGEPLWEESAIRSSGSSTTAIGIGRRDARTLSVLWEDGHRSDLDVRHLRLACSCALCKEEMSGHRLLDPKSVRADVTPRTLHSVGNYAINIVWNDGHSTGIYSFKHLRALGEQIAEGVAENV